MHCQAQDWRRCTAESISRKSSPWRAACRRWKKMEAGVVAMAVELGEEERGEPWVPAGLPEVEKNSA